MRILIRKPVTTLDLKGVKSSSVVSCDEGLVKYPDLFLDFISDLYFQIQEVPRDFFVDIGKDMLFRFLVAVTRWKWNHKVFIACQILCTFFYFNKRFYPIPFYISQLMWSRETTSDVF